MSEWVSSVLRPHQHSIGYTGDGFLQVKWPNQQYQSTEGDATRERKQQKQLNIDIQYMDNNAHTKRYTQNKHSKSPSLQ